MSHMCYICYICRETPSLSIVLNVPSYSLLFKSKRKWRTHVDLLSYPANSPPSQTRIQDVWFFTETLTDRCVRFTYNLYFSSTGILASNSHSNRFPLRNRCITSCLSFREIEQLFSGSLPDVRYLSNCRCPASHPRLYAADHRYCVAANDRQSRIFR